MQNSISGADLITASIRRCLHSRAARLSYHSRADADDLVQDTFERALRNLHRFERGSNLQAWLTTIMGRLLIDRQRRKLRVVDVELQDVPAPPRDDVETDLETAAIVTAAQLKEAISRLPPNFRCVLELNQYKGLSYAQIARHLGLPIGTVGTRILRAKRRLRALLLSELSVSPVHV